MTPTSCQLVFNELSIRDPADSVEMAREWMRELTYLVREARRRTAAKGVHYSAGVKSMLIGPDYSVNRWRNDRRGEVDRDAQAFLGQSFDRGQLIEENDLGIEAEHLGKTAEGLFAAFLLNSLALSVLSSDTWDVPEVEILVRSLTEGSELDEKPVSVHHLAKFEHLDANSDWLDERDGMIAVYRRVVNVGQAAHVKASEYAKHVNGRTNDERRARAETSGSGQYLAVVNEVSVTDDLIRSWEREALVDGWRGAANARVEQHSEATFYVYHEKDHTVGYVGETGAETRQLRVEWSSGNVHSHPRPWPMKSE